MNEFAIKIIIKQIFNTTTSFFAEVNNKLFKKIKFCFGNDQN